jgi:hypothetical protein
MMGVESSSIPTARLSRFRRAATGDFFEGFGGALERSERFEGTSGRLEGTSGRLEGT